MKDYKIKLIDKKIAKELIIKNHYSHKWSSCRYSLGLFDNNKLIGVAVYGFPVGRRTIKSISPILENDDVLELTRLWLEDSAPKNSESFFISKTFSWLRNNTKIKVLISYSDPMAGHVGIIYQATGWFYQGNNTMLIKGYLFKINGEIMHPRSVCAKYGSIKNDILIKIDINYKKIPTLKKHRYIFLLDKKYKKRVLKTLKHKICKYPKNNDGCKW